MFDVLLQQLVNGIVIGGVYSLLGLGLSLIYVVVRLVNFAHGDLVMIGAFATYYVLNLTGSLFFGAVAAVLIVIVASVILQRIAVQPLWHSPRMMPLIATIGISIAVSNLVRVFIGPNPVLVNTSLSRELIALGPVTISLHRLIVLFVAIAAVACVALFLQKTWTGIGLRALMENEIGAQLVGVNPRGAAVLTFGVAGAAAGLAGALSAPLVILAPSMGVELTLRGFAVLVLGGLGNIWGVILSGPIIGIAESLSAAFFPSGFQNLFVFAFMIIVLILRPNGLFGNR